MKCPIETRHIRTLLAAGYLLIALLVGGIVYTWLGEWRDMERLEAENREKAFHARRYTTCMCA